MGAMAIADLVKTTLGPKGMVRALRTLNRKLSSHISQKLHDSLMHRLCLEQAPLKRDATAANARLGP